MKQERAVETGTMSVQAQPPGEQGMVQKERWEEIRRMFFEQRVTVSQIARGFDLDRKTVRRCLRQSQWQPYSRAAKSDTLLAAHEQFVRERAAQVNYSARIVYHAQIQARLLRQLGHGQARGSAAARGGQRGRAMSEALRDAAWRAEPDRLGTGASVSGQSRGGAASVRVDAGL